MLIFYAPLTMFCLPLPFAFCSYGNSVNTLFHAFYSNSSFVYVITYKRLHSRQVCHLVLPYIYCTIKPLISNIDVNVFHWYYYFGTRKLTSRNCISLAVDLSLILFVANGLLWFFDFLALLLDIFIGFTPLTYFVAQGLH